jgi:hypothetical protein
MQPSTDLTGALRVDLPRGHLERRGLGPVVPLPVNVLGRLLAGLAEERASEFGAELGRGLGEGLRVLSQAGRSAGQGAPTVQVVADALGAEFALSGLGRVALEQWGRALVVVVRGSTLGRDGAAFLAGVVTGALGQAFERRVSVVPLTRGADELRLLVCGAVAAERVRAGLAAGHSWSSLIVELQAPEAA